MKGNKMLRHRIKKVPTSSVFFVFLGIFGCVYKIAREEYSSYNKQGREVLLAETHAKQMEQATLIDKRWGERKGYLFLDNDKNLTTTEGIVTVGNLSNPNKLAQMRDLTNGTVKTVQEWKKIGLYSEVRQ